MINITIRIANWEDDNNDLANIRRRVFIEEQNVPEMLEWDEADSTSMHFLALLDHNAVATARLTPHGQIGRMAVLPEYRGQGIGSQLLDFVIRTAVNQHIEKLQLHAQVNAIAFYKKHGFTTQGEIFYEAGIPHRKMYQ